MSERFFASDNSAPVHPAVMEALEKANSGHTIAYGDDPYTQRAVKTLQKRFGRGSSIHFVYNGTGANVVGMQAGLAGYHGVICTEISHINYDECGALERVTGSKLLTVPSEDGRLKPEQILARLYALGVEHHTQPRIVSLTQSTELGTVYDADLVKEIGKICRKNDLLLHMDGARISNAAVSQNEEIAEITGALGVDILSLGGTKNGLMFGEAVVFFNKDLARAFRYIRKQGMQLASKMRYIAVQFEALFGGDLWRELASHANEMAGRLARELSGIPGVDIAYPVEANAVFARLPAEIIARVQREVFFYVWDEADSVVRLMCSYDTQPSDIERLAAALRASLD